LRENQEICIDGNKLSDAILFKIDAYTINEKDMKVIKKELDIFNKHIEVVKKSDIKPYIFEESGAGSFMLPMSVHPYASTLLQINDDPTATPRLFWFLTRKNYNDDNLNAFSFIDLNNHMKGHINVQTNEFYLYDSIYRIDYYQDKNNHIIDFMNTFLKKPNGEIRTYRVEEKAVYFLFMYMGLKILSIVNCINVNTTLNKPSKELQKSRMRKNKLPLFSYYTLNIKLSKKQSFNCDSDICQYTNRIHLCRGHFKKRKTGVFWWQAHIRGHNREGIVMKDYNVKARQNA